MDTPILKGFQLYHNFVRPHEGLKGDTPADRAGIRIEGQNKWMTIIQNAAQKVVITQVEWEQRIKKNLKG